MVKLIINIICYILAIIFHKYLVIFGLKSGLSYTYSMIAPYVIQFIFICLIFYTIFNAYLRDKTKWIKRLSSLAIFGGLGGIAFGAHVIYDSDFNHEYNIVTVKGESTSVFEPGLTMLALAGCQFCYERVEELNFFKKLYPQIPIHVLVVNQQEEALEGYTKRCIEGITINHFPESHLQSSALNPQEFPTLFFRTDSKPNELIRWSNRGFGSAAWDMILKQYR